MCDPSAWWGSTGWVGPPHGACELTVYSQSLGIQAKDLPALGCSGLTWRVACALSGHYHWGLSQRGQLRWEGDPRQAWELEQSLGKRCRHAQCAHHPSRARAGTGVWWDRHPAQSEEEPLTGRAGPG